MKRTNLLLTLGAALLLAPLTSTLAQSTWETVDVLTPWRGRAIVADAAGNFISLAIDNSTSNFGPVSTAGQPEHRSRRHVADGVNQRITLVNELTKATSDPAALQALQQAQASLQNRLGQLAAAMLSPSVGRGPRSDELGQR